MIVEEEEEQKSKEELKKGNEFLCIVHYVMIPQSLYNTL